MEVEEIQTQQQQQPCKFSRVGNSSKLGHHHYNGEEEINGGLDVIKRPNEGEDNASAGGNNNNINSSSISSRLRAGWHQHSSRIIRVSRASGGKDRHSKVWTSKGLRDRRVRLSVTTAIQFYDLQDRLGYDQPSKAVEWLIKAAADSISELPSLNASFPPDHDQMSDDQKGRREADVEQQQHGSLSKSACSSTSETSKGSGLSLSRGDARVKARERARERTAKEKEKDGGSSQHQNNVSPISQSSSFTELLTAGIGNNNSHSGGSTETHMFQRAAAAASAARQWPLTPMDYLGSGILSGTPTAGRGGFPGQIQLGNTVPHGMTMSMMVPHQPATMSMLVTHQPAAPFSVSMGGGGEGGSNNNHHHHQMEQMQHFAFGSDHLVLPVAAAGGGSSGGVDYNLNFTISSSSGLNAGFNRGTLQSNSSSSTSSPQHSLLTHLQRFPSTTTNNNNSSPIYGTTTNNSVPFFIGASPAAAALESHHQHQFPPGLQLLYGDGTRHSDHKGKGKS